MAGRRMIDTAFWESEKVASLSMFERCLFLGIISNADDQGRIKATLIRARVFPLDDFTRAEIVDGLEEIAEQAGIIIYSVDDVQYVQVRKWWDYQRPNWAWPSKYPAPPDWDDREKYRRGNEIMRSNWREAKTAPAPPVPEIETEPTPPHDDPAVAPPPPHPEPVLTSAPRDSTSGSGSGSGRDSISSGKKPPERSPAGKNATKAILEEFFSTETGLPRPSAAKVKGRKAASVRWWQPLLEIAALVEDDAEMAKILIRDAIKEMDKQALHVSAPQSILEVARSIHGKKQRGASDGVLRIEI